MHDPSPLPPAVRRALRFVALVLICVGVALVVLLSVAPGGELGARLGAPTLIGSDTTAPLEPPPGDAAALAEAYRRRAPSSIDWVVAPWPTLTAVVVLALVVLAATATWRLEHGRPPQRPYSRGALLAPVLYLAGGLWLSRGAHGHALSSDLEYPDGAAWVSVPGFVWPGLVLLVAALATSAAALASVLRSARHGAPRAGLALAGATFVSAGWALWAVDTAFLAPPHLRGEEGSAALDLPTALNARWIERGVDPTLDVAVTTGPLGPRITLSPSPRGTSGDTAPFEGALEDRGWRDALVEQLARLPTEAGSPPEQGVARQVIAGLVHLAADERLRFADVHQVIGALSTAGVWKVAFVTERRGPGRSGFALLRFIVISPEAATETVRPRLELVPGAPGGPARVRFKGVEDPHVFAMLTRLGGAGSSPFGEVAPDLAVADEVTWAAFVQVLDALHDVDVLGGITRVE